MDEPFPLPQKKKTKQKDKKEKKTLLVFVEMFISSFYLQIK